MRTEKPGRITADELRAAALAGARLVLARIYATFPELRPADRPAQPATTQRPAKRPHWTQTPEGKRKLARRMLQQWRNGTLGGGRQ